jgi:hypothetical protein
MKKLLLISLLLLTGCSPSFQVGDCIALEKQEKWETDGNIFQIEQVGDYNYRLEWIKPRHMNESSYRFKTESIRWTDRIYEKVNCPQGAK